MEEFLSFVSSAIVPEEARGIDRDILLLAFMFDGRQEVISNKKYSTLLSKFGVTTCESLQFLGNGIWEAIVKYVVYQSLSYKGLTVMIDVINVLTSNNFISRLTIQSKLCTPDLMTGITIKKCADVFEALIGALFIHLVNIGHDAYRILYEWMVMFWKIPDFITNYLTQHNHPYFDKAKCLSTAFNYHEIIQPQLKLPKRLLSPDEIIKEAIQHDNSSLQYMLFHLTAEMDRRKIKYTEESPLTEMFTRLGV